MPRPFEVASADLQDRLEELVDSTFSDIQSQFLVLPRGANFVEYREFQTAYEVLRRRTNAFADFTEGSVWSALRENSLCFGVVRTILGMSPPEWVDLARSDRNSDISQGYARGLDGRCRSDRSYISGLVIIEAKITGNDGTARDKVARIERLTRMRDDRRRGGQPDFEVVACIDGRGFGVRREDMRTLILMTEGKVFTLATLDQLVAHTGLQEFLPAKPDT